ncbi:Enhanced entry protein EnhA [Legionella pneumophila subsp. pneumophila LPE509]|nr:Enhanced entry protein EnhA [Legionella pneumophila subsp. pneumophila LPE509]
MQKYSGKLQRVSPYRICACADCMPSKRQITNASDDLNVFIMKLIYSS